MNSPELDELRASLAGRYRLEEPVGEGAMAVVFRAWDLRHERAVALKVLRAEIREQIGSERFLREVQVAARLQHPHIVPLFDSGSAAGHVFYVMPFLAGETLRARMDRDGPLDVEQAVDIACQVAGALGHAHRHGVIHRDIKPENILLQEGHALVADFGVAFATSGNARLTATGLAVGTPAYMSPEQATGAPVDGRSDLYSLAAVLYEMLTDELPHPGRSAAEIVARKLTEAPRSIRDLRRNAPAAVAAAVERALALTPEDRFAAIDDFPAALAGRDVARVPTTRSLRIGARTPWLATVGVILATATLWFFLRPAAPVVRVDPYLVAMTPLQAADDGVAAALANRLAASLPGAPGPRLTMLDAGAQGASLREARARGAGRLLTGSVSTSSTGATVRLELEDLVRGRTLGQVTATGPRDSLSQLAEELALGVLRLEAGQGDPSTTQSLPRSLPALQAFTTGVARYRLARYPSAGESFQRAIEADSSFALAGLWLALTALEYGGPGSALPLAWERRASLSPRDQRVLSAIAGRDYPAPRDMRTHLADLEEVVFANDDRPELWIILGTFLARNGSFLGLPDGLRRAEGALEQALRYDPDRLAALERLVEVRGLLGDSAGLRSAAGRFLAIDSTSELAPFVRWRLALANRDAPTLTHLRGQLSTWNGVSLHQLIWTTQLEGLPPEDALAASAALLRRATNASEQRDRLVTRHDLLANLGRPDEAAAAVRQMRVVAPLWTGWDQYALADALFWEGDSALAAEARDSAGAVFRGAASDSVGRERRRRAGCQLGFWHATRGNADSASAMAGAVEAMRERRNPAPSRGPDCATVVRTVLAVRAGAPDARERVDSLERVARSGELLPGSGAGTNLLLSRLRQQLGDSAGARLYATRFWYYGRTMYVAPYRLQSGSLALAAGDSAAARADLRRVAALWSAGDSAHRTRGKRLLAEVGGGGGEVTPEATRHP